MESLAVEPAVAAPVFVDPLAPAPAPSEPPAPILAEPPAPAVAEPPAPVFVEPPTPIPAEPGPRCPWSRPRPPSPSPPPRCSWSRPHRSRPSPGPRCSWSRPPPWSSSRLRPFSSSSGPARPTARAGRGGRGRDRPGGARRGVGRTRARRRRRRTAASAPATGEGVPWAGPPGRAWLAHPSRNMVRLVVFTVLAGLIPIAGGDALLPVPGRDRAASRRRCPVGLRHRGAGRDPAGPICRGGRAAPTVGNAFAAGCHHARGRRPATPPSKPRRSWPRCLHVPVSAVDGAFGMGSAVSQRDRRGDLALLRSIPSGNGGAVSSVVDVVQSAKADEATDASVFQDPALFATCYQPFVQAMLPYASGASGATGFATATVQPIVVPVPAGPGRSPWPGSRSPASPTRRVRPRPS